MNDFETRPLETDAKPESQIKVPPESSNQHSSARMTHIPFWLVLVAFLAGVVGGVYGSVDLANRQFVQNWFGGGQGGGNEQFTQNISLTEESAITQVVAEAGKAVVSIAITKEVSQPGGIAFGPFGFFNLPGQSGPREVGAGTGFFVSEDGWVMTNKHVVDDETASYTVLTNDGQSYEAKVMAKDPVNDLAILKIEISNAPFLKFANSNDLQLGQRVIAIGNSLGQYQNTVTTGVISGIGRNIRAGGGGMIEQLDGVIQTDAAINRGNSGGPLLSANGLVIGINTAVDVSGQAIGFAIPANDASSALQSYQQNGRITRPYLGVRYAMVTKAIAESNKLEKDYGALLVRGQNPTDFAVIPGSPADRSGLKENDIILEIEGQKLDENNSLVRIIKKYKPGQRVSAKIYRDGGEQTLTITIGETK